jgi:hypothetical protein
MPLNWDASRIEKFKDNDDAIWIKSIDGEGYDCEPVLKTFIFAGGMVGLSSIKHSNVAEWYARFKVCEEMYDMHFMGKIENGEIIDVDLEPEVIREYIGLRTNHSTYSTSEWVKRVVENQRVELTENQIKARIKKHIRDFDGD